MNTLREDWGGLIGSLFECRDLNTLNSLSEDMDRLIDKLCILERMKTLEAIRECLKLFSEENRIPSTLGQGHPKWVSYLNSPLLDEIFDTISAKFPLLYCCEKNKPKALEFYMKRVGFLEINLGLGLAACYGHSQIVDLLARIDHQDYNALNYAARHGNLEVIKILLRYSVSEDGKNNAMKIASKHGHNDIVDFLLNHKNEDDA